MGDPDALVPPDDPFLVQSIDPRVGTHPLTGAALTPIGGATFNSINGHERDISEIRHDLQYSCISPLADAIDCSDGAEPCECVPDASESANPLCRNPSSGDYETTRYFDRAFPSPRMLTLLKTLAGTAGDHPVPIVAPYCPKNASDDTRPDFGHQPLVEALLAVFESRL